MLTGSRISSRRWPPAPLRDKRRVDTDCLSQRPSATMNPMMPRLHGCQRQSWPSTHVEAGKRTAFVGVDVG
jgi:hypothetical protein